LIQNKTAIGIAHRLSTVRKANIIFVVQDGRTVQHGEHDALLEQGGLYAEFYGLQFNTEDSRRTS
jgi:ABC-type multidrug transport system fused ATPase/permease subunit